MRVYIHTDESKRHAHPPLNTAALQTQLEHTHIHTHGDTHTYTYTHTHTHTHIHTHTPGKTGLNGGPCYDCERGKFKVCEFAGGMLRV